MKRRDCAIGLALSPLLGQTALAAGEPAEGREYRRVDPPVPVAVPGKIEIIEFFGYWCPHCNALEPALEPWILKLPSDVVFRRVPVGWSPMHVPYQRLYFALESMNLGKGIHAKVFAAVHGQGLRLDQDAGLAAFASANGIDKAKLLDAMNGFSVGAKLAQAKQLFSAYGLDGVPALTVQGRYVTSPGQAGGDEAALRVVDALVRKVRG